MALKPEDRYMSAQDLSADIEHWLADEPVTAYREPLRARLARWGRRHRGLVQSAAVLLVAAVIALTVGILAVNQERKQTELARLAEAEQREEADRQREEAVARETETKAVLDFVENRVFAAARPEGREGGLGHKVSLRKAVEASLPWVAKSFPDQPLIEARLRMTLGTSFWFLGDAEIAATQYQAARTLYAKHRGPDHPDTLLSMSNLANSYADLGRHVDALKLQEETLALRKSKLGPDHPDTLRSMHGLAYSYAALGRHKDALQLNEETLAMRKSKLGPDHPDTLSSMMGLAYGYAVLGRHKDALKLCEETLELQKAKLGPDHPDTLLSMNNLANSYTDLGRHEDALQLREETLALQMAKLDLDHPDTLMSMSNLANSYTDLGRHEDALKLHQKTLALRKTKLGPDHPDTLRSMMGLATSYAALGRHADALKLHEETLRLQKAKLGPDHSDTLVSMANLAESLVQNQRGAEAISIIDECTRRASGKVVDPRLMPFVMDLRLRHFEKTKDATGCRQTAVLWEKLKRTDAISLYSAACFRSVTAAVLKQTSGADATRLAKEEADRAMAWLKQAVAAGYKNAVHIEKDKDLRALRDREDFKKLLAELKGAKTEKK
jgi:tetratricopeptide (TPR) repeat protein